MPNNHEIFSFISSDMDTKIKADASKNGKAQQQILFDMYLLEIQYL